MLWGRNFQSADRDDTMRAVRCGLVGSSCDAGSPCSNLIHDDALVLTLDGHPERCEDGLSKVIIA